MVRHCWKSEYTLFTSPLMETAESSVVNGGRGATAEVVPKLWTLLDICWLNISAK